MRRLRNVLIALFISLCTPILIWFAFGAAMAGRSKIRRLEAISPKTCSTDAQCPPGFICISGKCVPR